MMQRTPLLLALIALAPAAAPAQSVEDLAAQVRGRETAFAKAMADRDHAAFATFVSEQAVFLGDTVRRGRAEVALGWKACFDGPQAPFSWAPERVEVIGDGTLAVSTGPVFVSTWRLETDGQWRVVLDGGCPPCACP